MNVRVDLKILFFLALFFLTNQLDVYIMVMLFCFVHECVHIIVAKLCGFKIQEIEIMPFGFWINIRANMKDYNKKFLKSNMAEFKRIFVAIVGPLTNIILAYILANANSEIPTIMVYSNLMIFAFNLIPIFPLDGGRILKSVFSIAFGRARANVFMNRVSNITIVLLTAITSIMILYLKNIAILFILMYLWGLVIIENKKFKLRKKAYEYSKYV